MPEVEERDEAPDRAAAGPGLSRATFVAGLVVGAAIGAGIALLVAPARGEVIRRRLGWRAVELGERAREGIDDVAHRAERDLLRQRRRLKARLDRLAEDARESLADLP